MYLSNDVMIHPQGDPAPVNTLPSSVSGDQRWLRLRYRDIDCWLSHPAPAIAGHETHICQDGLFPGHWMLGVHFVELHQYQISQSLVKLVKSYESFVKGWICWLRKWSEGDLPTFERIWWDFWKIDLLDASAAAAQTNPWHLAQGKWNRKNYLLNHFLPLVTCLTIIITLKHSQPRL